MGLISTTYTAKAGVDRQERVTERKIWEGTDRERKTGRVGQEGRDGKGHAGRDTKKEKDWKKQT